MADDPMTVVLKWVDSTAEDFQARYHVACNERLNAVREENGGDAVEVPQEQQTLIFHTLSLLNAKGREYPGGNLPDEIRSHAAQRRRMQMSESTTTEELPSRLIALTKETQHVEAWAMQLSQ